MSTLRELICRSGNLEQRSLSDSDRAISLAALVSSNLIDVPAERLQGSSILIATRSQFSAACVLAACDGVARRMVICPPGVPTDHLRVLADLAQIDLVLCDDNAERLGLPGIETVSIGDISSGAAQPLATPAEACEAEGKPRCQTEWVMLTSGTSGPPKLVIHTLQTLMGAMNGQALGQGSVWSTFYDIRRYGGLQIFLRAMAGGGTMVLSNEAEAISAFLTRVGEQGVTHMSGTPSHWRRALMSGSDDAFAPQYVRLSGEIADQSILDSLQTRFPDARISHAFASTEAGVAFEVVDGLAGFPASLIDGDGKVALRVVDGSLRIRSDRNALCYIGPEAEAIRSTDGYVDTGDIVEFRGDRFMFIGRRSGIINVGGLKIHPEEVEAVICSHPLVRMCVVKARKNPITGAVVTAEVVADCADLTTHASANLREEILALCRDKLERHKVPATIRMVTTLDMAISGKMRR